MVNVNATNSDPFTDAATPTQHVQIINNAGGNFDLTAGAISLAGISGGGTTTVQAGAVLDTNYLYQSVLTLGPGATLVINAISGGPTASSSGGLDTLPNGDLASPLSARSLSSVPEPSTWTLIVLGALSLLCWRPIRR